jgi:hypothetical protein
MALGIETKKFKGNYLDEKKHGNFIIQNECCQDAFHRTSENGELLETNYGF